MRLKDGETRDVEKGRRAKQGDKEQGANEDSVGVVGVCGRQGDGEERGAGRRGRGWVRGRGGREADAGRCRGRLRGGGGEEGEG